MLRLAALIFLAVPAFAAAPDAGAKPRVAVLYFDCASTDLELQAFTKGFASLLISDLVATDQLQVIERERLEAALSELKLGETRFADKSSFARLGKVLGADYLVVGSIMSYGKQYKIAARFFIPELTETVGQAKVDLDPADVFAAEEKLVAMLTAQLVKRGSIATAPEPAKKGHKLPMTTAVKYSRSLEAKDQKDLAAQKKLLAEVVKEEPHFKLAQLDLLSLRD